MTTTSLFEEVVAQAEAEMLDQVDYQYRRYVSKVREAVRAQAPPDSNIPDEVEKLLEPVRAVMEKRAKLMLVSRLAQLARDGGA